MPLAELARLGYRVQFQALPNNAVSTWAVEATHPGSALRYIAAGRTLQDASADLILQIKTASQPTQPPIDAQPEAFNGLKSIPGGTCPVPAVGG